jgi:hypothetical protein
VALDLDGLLHARLQVVGSDAAIEGHPYIAIGPDQTTELRVLVTAPAGLPLEKSTNVTFRATDTDVREIATARDHFILP